MAAVLDGRCRHMGTSLSKGTVVGECIRCPLHGWRFDSSGDCQNIPAQESIPKGAHTRTYPVEVRHGNVFFFNSQQTLFPLPFYENQNPKEFVCSSPFTAVINCPWHVISTNFFDEQHFRTAHDRKISEVSHIIHPNPFAQRIVGKFAVAGSDLRDRVWRRFFGKEVTLDHTQWVGTFSCTESHLERTTSYGMISLNPISTNRTELTLFAFSKIGNTQNPSILSRVQAEIRRYFIAKFLAEDWEVLENVSYRDGFPIDADRSLGEYLTWLSKVASAADSPCN